MTGRREVRALLAAADFRRLFAVRVISQGGDGLFQASLASAVFFNPEGATDPRQAALGFVVFYLPYSLVGPFVGVFADRWRRRRIAVWANVGRAALVLVTIGALLTVGPDDPLFYAAALSVLGMNRFYLATLGAALPHVVGRGRLVLANAIATTTGTATAFGMGILALLARDVLGAGVQGNARFALLGATAYVLAAGIATRIRTDLGPENVPDRPLRELLLDVLRDMRAAVVHVAHRPAARNVLGVTAAQRFCFGLILISTVLLYRNHFTGDGFLRGGEIGLGQAVAASTIGILTAAFVTPRLVSRLGKQRWITLLLVLAGTAIAVFGPPFEPASVVAAAAVLGFVGQGLRIAIDTTLQQAVDDDFRGRVFSFYDVLFNVALVASAGVAAVVVPVSGNSVPVILAVAAGYLLTALGFRAASRGVPDTGAAAPTRAKGGNASLL